MQLGPEVNDVAEMFAALWTAYDGQQAAEMREHWSRTMAWFEGYLEALQRLERLLDERRSSLDAA